MDITILEYILENSSNAYIIFQYDSNLVYENHRAREIFQEVHKNYLWKLALSHLEGEKEEREFRYEIGDDVYRIKILIEQSNKMIILEIKQCCNDNWLPFVSKILDKTGDLMFYKDASLAYQYTNNSFSELLKKEQYEIIGKKNSEFLDDDKAIKQHEKSDRITLEKGSFSGLVEAGGNYYRVMKERINGGVLCIAKNVTREIVEHKKATTDLLTGLYNRRNFNTVINDIYENREDGYYLTILDLDDFRLINNKYGHLVGDNCLQNLGEKLNEYAKGVFFRIGGDEFIGLIKNDKEHVITMMKDIQNKLCGEEEIGLTVSVGIKKLDLSVSYEENYKLADKVLYEAKGNGKNQFCIYE